MVLAGRRSRWRDDRAAGGTTRAAGGTDPAAPPTTTVAVADTVPGTNPCKVQPDGSEICEIEECASEAATSGDDIVATTVCERDGVPAVRRPSQGPHRAPPRRNAKEAATESPPDNLIECPLPDPGVDPVPDPVPEPQPLEVVLVDAERSLVLLPDNDGTR